VKFNIGILLRQKWQDNMLQRKAAIALLVLGPWLPLWQLRINVENEILKIALHSIPVSHFLFQLSLSTALHFSSDERQL
jgi:uncharacterized membrane protein YpjA